MHSYGIDLPAASLILPAGRGVHMMLRVLSEVMTVAGEQQSDLPGSDKLPAQIVYNLARHKILALFPGMDYRPNYRH
jgi:hypothetical protein